MWSIAFGIVVGFILGRTKISRNFKFIKIVKFSDVHYGVRFGMLGMYVYHNFNNEYDFPWPWKFSDSFSENCKTDKVTCEKYLAGNSTETVVD
jgi:hypothetical protein